MISRQDMRGFGHVMVLLVLVLVGAIGFAAWQVVKANKQPNAPRSSQIILPSQTKPVDPATYVAWSWDGNYWRTRDAHPVCKDPLALVSPVDIKKATAVLYPGQERSRNYKPHGGFRFDTSKNSDITVKAPYDGFLVEGSRYIEAGDVQYLFTFVNSCGVAYRFDHLLTLSPAMQQAANNLPAPKTDDSRTVAFDKPILIKAGDVIATAVGHAKSNNVSVDFGVYDLRNRNEAGKDKEYVQKHSAELSYAAYAVCWFDLLPAQDAAAVKALPAGDIVSGKTSDYCVK
jgi:hypothetical protein